MAATDTRTPVITYNSKTITFTERPVKRQVEVRIPRSIQTTISGASEVLSQPRVDVNVRVELQAVSSPSLLRALENWWAWAMQGNDWTMTLDSTRTVYTSLTTQHAAGATVLMVASASGITTGNYYVVLGGPSYQVIDVVSIAGTGVTIGSALDFQFPSGSIFRDHYYWHGMIRDPNQQRPIEFMDQGQGYYPPQLFNLHFEFYEATTY